MARVTPDYEPPEHEITSEAEEYGPNPPKFGSTGFTDKQQAALYESRKARRQRLGVVPQPSLP